MAARPPKRLRVLNPLQLVESTHIDIVLVLGPGARHVEHRGLCSDIWLETLASLDTRPRLLGYASEVRIDQDFEWSSLLKDGDRLLSALVKLCAQHRTSDRPILLVGHSFGGIILKQAMGTASAKAVHSDEYNHLLNVVVGLMFISTPHCLLEPVTLRQSAMLIVELCADGGVGKQAMAQLRATSQTLREIMHRFDEAKLRIDILTVYEKLVTKRKGFRSLMKPKSTVLIHLEIAKTRAQEEQCVGLSADHFNSVGLLDPDNVPSRDVCRWLQGVVKNAHQNMMQRLRSCQAQIIPSNHTSTKETISDASLSSGFVEKQSTPNFHPNESSSTLTNVLTETKSGLSDFETEMRVIFDNFAAQATLTFPCFMVDTFTQNVDFFGRDAILAQLDAALLHNVEDISLPGTSRMNHVILCGSGAVGKTEIATQFVYTRRKQFDAIFWIRAEDDAKLEADMGKIAARLGLLDPAEPHFPVVSRGHAKKWLSDPVKSLDKSNASVEKARWLVVFDNADHPELLLDYEEIFGKGSILITTRDQGARKTLPAGSVVINLQPFDQKECALFFGHLARCPSQKDKVVEQLTLEIRGLPLVIPHMAGVMRKYHWSPREFMEEYQDYSEHYCLLDDRRGVIRPSARRSGLSMWAIDKLMPRARALLEVISFLDPDQIQESIFVTKNLNHESTPLQSYPTTRLAYRQARGELVMQSLVRRNEDGKVIWIHRVLRDTVKSHLSKLGKERVAARFSTAVHLVKEAWPVLPAEKRHKVDRWPVCEGLYPHVLELHSFYKRQFIEDDNSTRLALAKLLSEAAWWQYERGNFSRARPLADDALNLCSLEEDRDLVSKIHDVLGCIANGTNDAVLSMRHTKKFLFIRQEIAKDQGENDVLLAYAHNQMGCSFMMADRYEEAQKYFLDALRIWQSIPQFLKASSPRFSKALSSMEYANLGLAYWLQGDFSLASSILEEGHSVREEQFGPMDTESMRPGRILYALGNVRFSQNRIEESEFFHQKALIQFQSTIGNTHHRTADVCHKLAQHCLRRGTESWFQQALQLVDQALVTWRSDEKGFAPQLARTMFLKAEILFRLKNEGAEKLRHRAAELMFRIRPELTIPEEELLESDFDELVPFWSR